MTAQAMIFVPGAKGSKLVDTNRVDFDTIWSALQSEFESIESLELTDVDEGIQYDVAADAIIRSGELERLAYGEYLGDMHGDVPIYIFSYDWRMSSVTNGERLDEFLSYLQEKSAASARMKTIDSFNVVTHSLGAQVVRAYMNLYTDPLHRLNKILFTVPPFAGSLDVVTTILCGEGFFGRTRTKIRRLVRGMPGAIELLPTYEGAARFDDGKRVDFFNSSHWQTNVVRSKPRLGKGQTDTAARFRSALEFSRKSVRDGLFDLSSLATAGRRRILVVARDGYKTVQSLAVVRKPEDQPVENFVDLEHAVRSDNGDGRVPHVSSCRFAESVPTLLVRRSVFDRDYSHALFLKDERVQRLTRRFFGRGRFDYDGPGRSVRRVKRVVAVESSAGGPAGDWTVETD